MRIQIYLYFYDSINYLKVNQDLILFANHSFVQNQPFISEEFQWTTSRSYHNFLKRLLENHVIIPGLYHTLCLISMELHHTYKKTTQFLMNQ